MNTLQIQALTRILDGRIDEHHGDCLNMCGPAGGCDCSYKADAQVLRDMLEDVGMVVPVAGTDLFGVKFLARLHDPRAAAEVDGCPTRWHDNLEEAIDYVEQMLGRAGITCESALCASGLGVVFYEQKPGQPAGEISVYIDHADYQPVRV